MLYLYLGIIDREKEFGDDYYPISGKYFDAVYEQEWFDDEVVRAMIKWVDKSEVIEGEAIRSPVLGIISPLQLSTGVKTLILLWKIDGFITSGERLGDNCWHWLFAMANEKDIRLPLDHCIPPQWLPEEMTCRIANDKNRLFIGGPIDFLNMWIIMDYKAKMRWHVEHDTLYVMYPYGIEITGEERLEELERCPDDKYWVDE